MNNRESCCRCRRSISEARESMRTVLARRRARRAESRRRVGRAPGPCRGGQVGQGNGTQFRLKVHVDCGGVVLGQDARELRQWVCRGTCVASRRCGPGGCELFLRRLSGRRAQGEAPRLQPLVQGPPGLQQGRPGGCCVDTKGILKHTNFKNENVCFGEPTGGL